MSDRILVIEDDAATRYAYERALGSADHQTLGFPSYFAAAAATTWAWVDWSSSISNWRPEHQMPIARMARQHRPAFPSYSSPATRN